MANQSSNPDQVVGFAAPANVINFHLKVFAYLLRMPDVQGRPIDPDDLRDLDHIACRLKEQTHRTIGRRTAVKLSIRELRGYAALVATYSSPTTFRAWDSVANRYAEPTPGSDAADLLEEYNALGEELTKFDDELCSKGDAIAFKIKGEMHKSERIDGWAEWLWNLVLPRHQNPGWAINLVVFGFLVDQALYGPARLIWADAVGGRGAITMMALALGILAIYIVPAVGIFAAGRMAGLELFARPGRPDRKYPAPGTLLAALAGGLLSTVVWWVVHLFTIDPNPPVFWAGFVLCGGTMATFLTFGCRPRRLIA